MPSIPDARVHDVRDAVAFVGGYRAGSCGGGERDELSVSVRCADARR